LVSTEKPFTIENVEVGENLQMAASAKDLARLKQLAEQAQNRYVNDKEQSDIAVKTAEKALAGFEKVKQILESKVEQGKQLQVGIRQMQDELAQQREKLASATDRIASLQKNIRSAKAAVTSVQNKVTSARLAAQRAKVIADKAELQVDRFKRDVNNANKVADANELAVAAAEDATVDIEVSSNLIDKIVSSEKVDSSIKSLPAIATVIMGAVAAFLAVYAITKAIRRRRNPLLAPTKDDKLDLDLEFDFDQILAEIKAKQSKSKKPTQSKK
jgi:chromosome segregation ATPase